MIYQYNADNSQIYYRQNTVKTFNVYTYIFPDFPDQSQSNVNGY